MANTYTQIHIQIVFAVKYRECLIRREWNDQLYKYMTGIIQKRGHKVLQINGMPDHIHILIGLRPNQSLSQLIQQVKELSTKWINRNGLTPKKFSWQLGFGAFSYAKTDVPRVIRYIQNQEIHHQTQSFTKEYIYFLCKHRIEFDERYIFQAIE